MNKIPNSSSALTRLDGIDSLRFILAFWVVLFHLQSSLFFTLLNIPEIIKARLHLFFNGQEAVIIFFIISGLCIHFPQRKKDKYLNVKNFYIKRLLRISVPLIVIKLIDVFFISGDVVGGVIWSLYCEIAYYIIYPILLNLRRKLNWGILIGLSSLFSFSIIYIIMPKDYMQEFGDYLNWIVWLPVWLIGCYMAEQTNFPSLSRLMIWLVRIFVWLVASSAIYLTWAFPLGLSRVLFFFAIPGYFWVWAEIGAFKTGPIAQRLEQFGAWSYSLYLVHPLVIWWGEQLLGGHAVRWWGATLVLIAALVMAYIFHFLVERPSTKLARSWGTR